MSLINEIIKSFKSLLLYRLRTFLSTLGVLFGVLAVVTMLSIGEGAKRETLEQIAQLGMNSIILKYNTSLKEDKKGDKKSTGLKIEDTFILKQNLPEISSIAPLKLIENTTISSKVSHEVLAVTPSYKEIKDLQLAEGRFLCDLDLSYKHLVCVLGYEIAKSLGNKGHVGNSLQINNVDYSIIGVLKPTHWKVIKNRAIAHRNLDLSIFIPLGTEKSLPGSLNMQREFLSEITLKLKDVQQMPVVLQLIKKILRGFNDKERDYQVIVPRELLEQANRTQKMFNLVLGSIATISLLVGGIGIMNIMLATVSERTKEIGIRRAVGANKQHILFQFLLETLLLTSLGALLGVFLGICCSFLISFIAGWKTVVTAWSIFISLFMACGVGLFSGLYPALRAANMDPIQALRHF